MHTLGLVAASRRICFKSWMTTTDDSSILSRFLYFIVHLARFHCASVRVQYDKPQSDNDDVSFGHHSDGVNNT